MELNDKTSYLMLFSALLLARSRQASLAKALSLAPLSRRTRPLADLLGAGRRAAPDSGSKTVPAEAQELADAASGTWQPFGLEEGDVHPTLGSQHVSGSGPVTEILTRSVHLRCPVCGNEATVELDTWQLDHLRIRAHLDLYCRYCGTNSLWVRSAAAEQQPSALVL
ncbi:MAG: hypothetical protein HY316_01950 [Acidobacteria bacterium]|nr:hypothetical protein [Acidobacteriota bacterium]